MMVTTIPYFVVPRDEDHRINREFSQLFFSAWRWQPEPVDVDPESLIKGASAMRSLATGSAIDEERMQLAVGWVVDAIAYYEDEPVEPYEGRNADAVRDFNALLDAVTIEVTV